MKSSFNPLFNTKNDNPCYECENRNSTCHVRCEDYRNFCERKHKLKEKTKKQKLLDDFFRY